MLTIATYELFRSRVMVRFGVWICTRIYTTFRCNSPGSVRESDSVESAAVVVWVGAVFGGGGRNIIERTRREYPAASRHSMMITA